MTDKNMQPACGINLTIDKELNLKKDDYFGIYRAECLISSSVA